MRHLLWVLTAVIAWGADPVSLRVVPSDRTLRGGEAMQQFLAIAAYADGSERDVTDVAAWKTPDSQAAAMVGPGLMKAVSNGRVQLTATLGSKSAAASVLLEGIDSSRPFSFARDVGGVLTRLGCNGSNCHGGVKGRGGFKLSNGALHPKEDYEWIVKGGEYQVLTTEIKGKRIPRIDLQTPENSLLLRKPSGQEPHGGSVRFRPDSGEYQMLLGWIRSGAPYGADDSPESRVIRLEVFPSTVTLERAGRHRLLVTAHLADGRAEDFTRSAVFTMNDKEVATVDNNGVVLAKRLGETSVLVRAAGGVGNAIVGVVGDPLPAFADVPRANFIDDFVFSKLRKLRILPSGLSGDAEFLRRVCLDLTGTLPPPSRVREFLSSRDPDKRSRLIDTLMNTPEFVDYWTFRFDDVFRVAVSSNGIMPKWSQMYGDWVRSAIETNKPYDQIARERLTAQGYDGPTRHYLPYNVIGPPGETMAEEMRVFLGRRLDCAQCHNHPYESWSQDQFWGLAAFFGRVFKMGDTGTEYVIFDHPVNEPMGNGDVNGSIAVLHPRTKAEMKPTLLDGRSFEPSDRENPRKILAEWVTRHPWFAEAAVNRIWSYFFGRGLVDPVDDFRSTNPPTHPELLERLAENFRQSNHDLRHLIRTVVSSRTYQLSGIPNSSNRQDRTNYSHAPARPLDAEVLLDAITSVTGVPEVFTAGVPVAGKPTGRAPVGTRAINLREPDLFYSRFLELYGRPNRLSLPERNPSANLTQALHMLAGDAYNQKLSAPQGRLMQLIRAGKSDRATIEEFYLAAYARLPDPEETVALEKLIADSSDRESALKHFVWSVLCSREFAENH